MILIRSVKIIDGTGKSPFAADVLLRGDRISAIGHFPTKKADLVIDGLGQWLAPGFIDVHTDADHALTLFADPGQHDFLLQGVTTIIGGHCGSSLAPLLYGACLESIQKWADTDQINVGWRSLADFFTVLEQRPLGVNFGTLVGHSTVRRALLGEARRDLTDGELATFETILTEALAEGALGLSTGLSYVHSRAAPFAEIAALADVVRQTDGTYTTHLRNERERLVESAAEAVALAERTGVRTVISHLRPRRGCEEQFQRALELINSSRADVWFDSYPAPSTLMPVYQLLPSWFQQKNLAVMYQQLLDPALVQRVMAELPRFKKDEVVIVRAPGNDCVVGKSLGAFAANQGLTVAEGLLRLMIITRLKALVLHHNLNEDLLHAALLEPRALMSSNSLRLGPRAFLDFLYLSAGKLTLEEAVRRVTAVPAQRFRLRQRGVIKEGYHADLVFLKDGGERLGVATVIINGQVAVQEGKPQGLLAGQVIRSR